MQEKLMALSTPEKAIAGGGLLMLIASFFAWFKISVQDFASLSKSGWAEPGAIWSILAILIAVALAAAVLAPKLGNVQLPALPPTLTWGQVYGGGAAAVVVLMLLKLWRIMAVDACGGADEVIDCSSGPSIGFFLGAIAAAAIAYGGYIIYSQEKSGVARM